MMQIINQNGLDHLVVGGRHITASESGGFNISYALLGPEDLSVLPVGTFIQVEYDNQGKNTFQDPVQVKIIEVLNSGDARIHAEYFHCPELWEDALGSKRFAESEYLLFINEPRGVGKFDVKGVMIGDDGKPRHYVTLDVRNGSIKTIEQQVADAVASLLKSAQDHRAEDEDEGVEEDNE